MPVDLPLNPTKVRPVLSPPKLCSTKMVTESVLDHLTCWRGKLITSEVSATVGIESRVVVTLEAGSEGISSKLMADSGKFL